MNRRHQRGFTTIELMVVVLIVGALAAMTYAGFGRMKQRATLNGLSSELHAVLHGARQTALATGHQVVVMVFPDCETAMGTGRIVLYQDGDADFFTAGAGVNFDDYDCKAPKAGPKSEILDTIDLASNVAVGPELGQGPGAVMPAPYGSVAIDTFCSFCTGKDRRGAVAFDALGAATFHDAAGAPLGVAQGGSFSVTHPDSQETRTFVVAATTGTVQVLRWNPTP